MRWVSRSCLALFIALVVCPRAEAKDYRVLAATAIGVVKCLAYREGWFTTTTGPCSQFIAPPRIAIGETFSEGGTNHVIRVIIASEAEEDGPELIKKGGWYCAAAETEEDLGETRSARTWLFIPHCAPGFP